jgi:hypothetical protein
MFLLERQRHALLSAIGALDPFVADMLRLLFLFHPSMIPAQARTRKTHAQAHGVTLLRLETGIHQREAIGLYEHSGFYRIPPFGPCTDDSLSRCYERRIT